MLLLLVGVLSSGLLFARLGGWLIEDPDRVLERIDVLLVWLAVLSLPLLVAGILTCRSGLRSIATERFPPRGMWLILDTPIETGPRARFRGRMLALFGILMVVLAIAVPAALWHIVHSIIAAA